MAASAASRLPAGIQGRRRGKQRPGPGGIRWDRVARISLLLVLVAIVVSYVEPAANYVKAWRLARETRGEVNGLRRDNDRLRAQAKQLQDPQTIELEARRIGMARPGERVYVIRGLPKGP